MNQGTLVPVYLIRHGQTASNLLRRYAGREQEQVTQEGREGIRRVALTLQPTGFGSIWTSSIERARQTALLIEATLHVPVREESFLDEMLLGPWEGLTEDEIESRYPREYEIWNTRPDLLNLPGRETLQQVANRITSVAERASCSSKPVLLVTHVALIRVLALSVLGEDLSAYKHIAVPNASCFRVDTRRREVVRLPDLQPVARELAVRSKMTASDAAEARRTC